jgi:hypothetical protein
LEGNAGLTGLDGCHGDDRSGVVVVAIAAFVVITIVATVSSTALAGIDLFMVRVGQNDPIGQR